MILVRRPGRNQTMQDQHRLFEKLGMSAVKGTWLVSADMSIETALAGHG